MAAVYGNTILESSCDETVIEVDFVELKVEKSKKKISLVFTFLQPLVRLTNNFQNVLL